MAKEGRRKEREEMIESSVIETRRQMRGGERRRERREGVDREWIGGG
jgi:hypothetical protein